MRKIGTTSIVKALVISGTTGVCFTLLTFLVLWPAEVKQQPLSVLNYKSIDISRGEITLRGSPFLSASKRLDEPVLPIIPDQELLEAEASGKMVVLGVIPPEIAIIKKGESTQTVRVGEETAYGTVEYVTRSGVAINGRFLSLK